MIGMKFIYLLPLFLILFASFGFIYSDSSSVCKSDLCLLGACRTVTLTPQQVQSIWDNFLFKGIKPSEMRSGDAALAKDANAAAADALAKGADKNCPTINVIEKNSPMGAAVNLKCNFEGADAKDTKLSETCKGDYAVGMVLNTTMRLGRCEGTVRDPKICSVYDNALAFSNGVTGYQLAKRTFMGLFSSDALSSDFTKKIAPEIAKKNEDAFLAQSNLKEPRPNVDINDLKDSNLFVDVNSDVPGRVKSDVLIKNHIMAQGFNVEFQDICTGSDAPDRCKIYIYSFFNKYYNSTYSGSLLVATAGPGIYGLSQRAFKKLAPKSLVDMTDRLSAQLGASKYILKSGGYEKAAINASNEVRSAGILGADATKIKDLEKAFSESSADKLRQSWDAIKKGLDDPAKRQAFVKYLETKNSFGRSLSAELKALTNSSDTSAAIDILIKQDKTSQAMGFSVMDLFFEKKGLKYSGYYAQDAKGVLTYTQLSEKAVRERALRGELDIFRLGTVDKSKFQAVVVKDLEDFVKANPGKEFIVSINGVDEALNGSTATSIKGKLGGQTSVNVYDSGTHVQLSPDEQAKFIKDMQAAFIDQGQSSADALEGRSLDLLQTMKDQGVVDAKYWNAMQWLIYNEKYTLSSDPGKALVMKLLGPQTYWMVKTSDDSPFKAYFVGNRDMSNVTIWHGTGATYNDAYIDFFANEEFSSGDFFGELFVANLGKAIGAIIPTKELEKNVLNFMGVKTRTDIKDVVYYTGTMNNCPDCTTSRKISPGNRITITTIAKNDTTNYLLELPDAKTASQGLSLAVFTHHTNIDFNLTSSSAQNKINDSINIEEAIAAKETCFDKIKSSVFGTMPVLDNYFQNNSARIGLAMGIIDNTIFYVAAAFFPVMGVIAGGLGTYLIDDQVMTHFQDCVDSEEGYYIHYVHKFEDASPQKQGVLDTLVSKGGTGTTAPSPDTALSKVDSAISEIKDKLMGLVDDKQKEFMQIHYTTKNDASGKYDTGALFLTWIGPRAMCGQTGEDKSLIVACGKDQNSKTSCIAIDKNNNTISVDGNVILDSELVAMTARNGIFGGYEIPHSATFIPADLGVDYFELLPNGDFKIIDSSTTLCFMSGCKEQTGFNYSTPIEYTGLVTEISSKLAGTMNPNGKSFLMLGGASERQDISESLIIDGKVHLVSSINKQDLGEFSGVTFQKGMMIYRTAQKDFMLWIRIIAQINGRDVQKFSATPVTVTNPTTGCEEQAFNLSVLGNQNDTTAKAAGEKFDQALQNAGPFQYFETPDYQIMFYSKKDTNGQCKQYMKVVDKKTGKVISDSEIKSLEATDTGFKVTTADGVTHSLDFSNENGRPMLSFDGKKGDLLLAQGRNGSFYFDPTTGEWTVGNSQMLPFSDKFATDGWVDVGGVTKPGGNPIYSDTPTYGKTGAWDIPLFEGNEKYLLIFASLFATIMFLYFINKKEFE